MKIESKIIRDIKKYGWHIIHVMEDNIGSGYSYTIGLQETFNHPEVVISGLNADISAQILNGIGDSIRDGKFYELNEKHDDILDGYNCVFKPVLSKKYGDYFGRAEGYYQDRKIQIIQCFYPDKNGLFPWENGYKASSQEII